MALDVFGVLDEGRLVVEEGRTSISVTYFVLAVSQLQALARLRDRRIERGAVYESLQGEAVSFGLVARELEVMVQKGKGVGSEGMYYVKVLFETPGGAVFRRSRSCWVRRCGVWIRRWRVVRWMWMRLAG